MITSLEIENFKGIAARQRIEFAPLTLLFGANSAGKSTILQALLYLHELIERGSADVDRTELGGSVLELGGFARLVHRHETERAIVLRAEFATAGRLERFGRDLSDFPFPDLEDEIDSAWVELTIRFRSAPTFRGPLIENAVIGVNGEREPLVWLEAGTPSRDREGLVRARVNLGHPLLTTEVHLPSEIEPAEAEALSPIEGMRHAPFNVVDDWEQIAIPEVEQHHPEEGDGYGGGTGDGAGTADGWGFADPRTLPVFTLATTRHSALPPLGEPLRVVQFGDDSPEKAAAAQQVRDFLEMVVLGTTRQLSSFLRDGLYIGPLRTIPPRGFLYERPGRVSSWADGLAAWELLLADRLTLVERTNEWLNRLGTGCQVVTQQLFDPGADAEEISVGHVDKTVRRLLLKTGAGSLVLPSEVGAGVSQVMPVVVAALEARSGLMLVEQPEIHVHPALQVTLGDLFIEAVTDKGGKSSRRSLLIETHSEHLILRLLRRIRETTEKDLAEGAPKFTPDQLSVLYVESPPEGVRIRRLRVDESGEFVDRWPKGFFAERAEELF
jgi:hypothetical protein